MTANAIESESRSVDDSPGQTLSHYYCCVRDVALCGTDIAGHADAPDIPEDIIVELCVVCREVKTCALCGTALE